MTASALQPALAVAAFGLAITLHGCRAPAEAARFVASLLLGVLTMHVGFALAFAPGAACDALATGGVSLLYLPLGPLLYARRPEAFAALPLPIALARLGCVAAGCCRGEAGALLPCLDAAAFVVLHGVCGHLPEPRREGGFLIGFGAIRLAQTPWRGADAGPVPACVVAAGWLAFGVLRLRR